LSCRCVAGATNNNKLAVPHSAAERLCHQRLHVTGNRQTALRKPARRLRIAWNSGIDKGQMPPRPGSPLCSVKQTCIMHGRSPNVLNNHHTRPPCREPETHCFPAAHATVSCYPLAPAPARVHPSSFHPVQLSSARFALLRAASLTPSLPPSSSSPAPSQSSP
jgi:hypothetical protein